MLFHEFLLTGKFSEWRSPDPLQRKVRREINSEKLSIQYTKFTRYPALLMVFYLWRGS